MDERPPGKPGELTSRAPEQGDLVKLCRELNAQGANYIVIGGFAVIHAGYPRFTGDIDLLIDISPDNERRVYRALESLPDRAVKELQPGDVARYMVVRIADEIVVDLMRSACAIEYAEAAKEVEIREIEGVRIPFASPHLLWRMKNGTHRAKDAPDLLFLRRLLEDRGEKLDDA